VKKKKETTLFDAMKRRSQDKRSDISEGKLSKRENCRYACGTASGSFCVCCFDHIVRLSSAKPVKAFYRSGFSLIFI